MNMVKHRLVKIHPSFKLNGSSYTTETLREQANEYIKVGEPYQEAVGTFLLEWLSDSKYVLTHTSGSTGAPKPIKILKRHMMHSAFATAKHFSLPEKTTALLCLPVNYIAGKMMLTRALVLGWHLDITIPKSNPLDAVYRRYDFCAMTPFQLDNSLGRLHLIKKLIVGGGAVSPALILRLKEVDTKIYETYGMTETVTHIAVRRINSKKEKQQPIPFKTMPKVTVSLDERSCLVIKAKAVSRDPVITNDVAKLLSHKRFIWLGRIDNVVNSGGIKLFPEKIEEKLATLIDVPFFVGGIPDDQLGQKLVLFVENSAPYTFAKADIAALELDKFEIPKAVVTLASFDRTDNGKLRRGQTIRRFLITQEEG